MPKARQTKQEKLDNLMYELTGIDHTLENALEQLYTAETHVRDLKTKRARLQQEILQLGRGRKKKEGVKKNVQST